MKLKNDKLYFAYGSNLFISRLMHRVGFVEVLKTETLKNWKLYFTNFGYANIKPSEPSEVEGVIYKLTGRQLLILDHYEGLYERVSMSINGIECFTYIDKGRFKPVLSISKPNLSYINFIIDGCLNFNLINTAEELKVYKKNNYKVKSNKHGK